jgi:Serine aminopeptidase, S33
MEINKRNEFIFKWLKKPFFGKYMVKWRNPMNEDEKKKWAHYEVGSKSGGKIKTLYSKTDIEAKAVIILAHPMGKEAKGFFIKNGYTELYKNNGFHVILFDFNGFGESSCGNFSFFEDIVAVSHFAKEMHPDLPILYHGVSLGGQMSTIAFADKSHTIDYAIVESGATSLEEFWISYPIAYRFLFLFYFFVPKYRKTLLMRERIKEAVHVKSILFIYSHTDKWTPVWMGEKFKENCPVSSELWTVKEAKHTKIMDSIYKEEYKTKILDYFNQALHSESTIPINVNQTSM